jgi:hypothetical protein
MSPQTESAAGPRDRRALRVALCVALSLLTAVAFATPAMASEAIDSFNTTTSDTSAGAHPDFTTSFTLHNPGAPDAAQNVIFNAPEGLFGNPFAITHCTSSDFALDQCPSNSQAGLVTVYDSSGLLGTGPIFDVDPQGDQTALFAFIVPILNIPINIPVAVRTGGDYGLRFTVQDISQSTPLAGADLTFWGFPADSSHNLQRFPKGFPGNPSNCPEVTDTSCLGQPVLASEPVHPLTDNPTTCSGPLTTSLTVQTYQDPNNPTTQQSSYPATTDCDREVFNPVLFSSPTTDQTDAPSGLNIELSAPQFLGRAAAPSEIKSSVVTLPQGFTINPDAADGQTACADGQANFGTEAPANCPDNSKIGTFAIGTQALPGPLTGAVYIGQPKPGDQYRLFLVADGFGIHAKLVGDVRPDPITGQVAAHFDDLPQVPFEDFQLHLFSSDRGLMATPTQCSIYSTTAHFFPWNTTLPDQTSTQVFSLETGPHGADCPGQVRPFEPSLGAGTSNPVGGAFSSFTLHLDREDGDQFLGKLNFTMPPGLTANLTGITYCPEASIAAAANTPGKVEQHEYSCPASSQIGTTNVAAGPGSHPFHAVGRIYLAGPFKGAPLSLVAITPALAGPYDYGTVVVRVAINVGSLDAHVIADSETVPSIIGGIPIRMRSIQVNVDRPNFMINPTNCSPFTVASQGIGDQGTVASFSSPFQAVNCFALPFAPKMTIKQLGSHKVTLRSKNPALRIDLTTRPGDANIKSVAVTLPNAFEIDQRHLGNLCSETELAATHCAGRQAIGTATTETPLLERPLTGPVYAVSGGGGLPRLAFILSGQVMLIPRAEASAVGKTGRLRTVVPTVPDAPVGHFRLDLYGGGRGYLTNTRSLCAAPAVSTIEFTAQNGRTLTRRVRTKTACKTKSKRHKARRHRRHRRG